MYRLLTAARRATNLVRASPLLVKRSSAASLGAASVLTSSVRSFCQAAAEEVQTESGLKYKDVVVGEGETPQPGDTVHVHYTGYLEDDTVFDSSRKRGQPLPFTLGAGQVIQGWDEGISTMKVGGRRTLIIPPELGYGARGIGPIPGNATLIFDCELVSVTAPKGLFNRMFK